MRCYQFYLLYDLNQIEEATAVISCGSDQEVIRKAKLLVNEYDIELWDGSRFIGRFEPERSTVTARQPENAAHILAILS